MCAKLYKKKQKSKKTSAFLCHSTYELLSVVLA